MNTKADYQKWIWTYKKRRKILKRKTHSLTLKITLWEACLRDRKKTEKKRKILLNNLVKSVNEYFGLNIKDKNRDKRHTLARNIYYKVGLETKLAGTHLSRFIGRSKRMAMFGRKHLLDRFKYDQNDKEAYHNFKKYFEN